METLLQADIFFFISSIGFVIVFGIVAFALISVIGILRSVHRISKKLEGDVEDISAEAKAFFADVRASMLYRMIFGSSRKKK